MVCLGNICRSPMAEGVLKSKIAESGLHAKVDSAGIVGYHTGETPDKRAMQTALEFGVDISDQRARQVADNDFEEFDALYAMDQSVYQSLLRLAGNEYAYKVELFMNAGTPGCNTDVPDPYYGGDEGFVNVFNMIDATCDVLVSRIKNNETLTGYTTSNSLS